MIGINSRTEFTAGQASEVDPSRRRIRSSLSFTMVPDLVEDDPRLDALDTKVLRVLAKFAWNKTTCFPSNQTIARRAHSSPTSVKRRLAHLVACGHIKRERVQPSPNNWTGRVFVLLWRESEDYLIAGKRSPTRPSSTTYDNPSTSTVDHNGPGRVDHNGPRIQTFPLGTTSKSNQRDTGKFRAASNGNVQPIPSRGSDLGAYLDNVAARCTVAPPPQVEPTFPPPPPPEADPPLVPPASAPLPQSPVRPVEASRERGPAEDRPAAGPPAQRPARARLTPEEKLEAEVAELIKLLDDPVARDHAIRHLRRLGRLPAHLNTPPPVAPESPPVAEAVADQVDPGSAAPAEPEAQVAPSPQPVAPDPTPKIPNPEIAPLIAEPVPAPPTEASTSAYDQHLEKARAGAATRAAAQAAHRERLKSALENPKFKGDKDLLARLCEVGPGMTSLQVSRLAAGLANALNDGKSQARYAQLLWTISEGRQDRLLLAMCYVETVEARNQKGWPLGKVMGGRLKELVPIFF